MEKFLSRKQRKELLEELKLERMRRYTDRIRVILLLDDGEIYRNIAKVLFLDEGTISNYKKCYKLDGIEGLINDDYLGKKSMLTEKDLKVLSSDLQKRIFPTARSVITHVKRRFGVRYSRGGIIGLLHRLGFSYKKPKGVPDKADRAEQEKFIRKYKRAKSQGGLIYVGDATHPTFNTALNYGWIKKGEDFEVETNSGRLRININGAIEIKSIPTAFQDWSNTKAAYRFLSNPNVSESEIMEGHFQSTKSRFQSSVGPVLVLHDTTEITYKRHDFLKIGVTRKCANRKGLFDQNIKRAMCGILMHSSLAVTSEGLPLGLCGNRFWSREKFKNVKALYRKKNATRIPIGEKESYRWLEGVSFSNNLLGESYRLVHVGDREADIYDFFQRATEEDSNFLVRIKVDRRSSSELPAMNKSMSAAKRRGVHWIDYKDEKGRDISVKLGVKFEKIKICPPHVE